MFLKAGYQNMYHSTYSQTITINTFTTELTSRNSVFAKHFSPKILGYSTQVTVQFLILFPSTSMYLFPPMSMPKLYPILHWQREVRQYFHKTKNQNDVKIYVHSISKFATLTQIRSYIYLFISEKTENQCIPLGFLNAQKKSKCQK